MRIRLLGECPHHAATVAQWHFDEWGHLYPGGTVDGWLDHIRTRMNADRIPMTVVALDAAGEPVGTAALTEHDMETHRELSPWLGGVYVVPTARGRGVASALIEDLLGRAAALGIPGLYLYTNGAEGLYRKLGWSDLAREPYMGRDVTVMAKTLSPLPGFTTERLVLRGATAADLDVLWTIWRDSDVRRYLFDDKPVDRETATAVLESALRVAPRGLGLWLVERREHPGPIGCVALLPVGVAAQYDPTLNGLVEPVAAFVPAVWGHGYANEALRAVLSYGFATLGLLTIAGVTDVPNEASDRMLRRLGFDFVHECDGPYYRARVYHLERARFLGGHAG